MYSLLWFYRVVMMAVFTDILENDRETIPQSIEAENPLGMFSVFSQKTVKALV